MKDVWFISGLGADERAFQYLDFKDWRAHFVSWIPPLEGEKIENYARRLAEQIKGENPILVGYSFGGMVAVEIAHFMPVDKIIIVASVKTRKELPPYFRLAGKIPIYKIVPVNWVKKPMWLYYRLFGVKGLQNRKLLKEIISDTDTVFLRWSMDVITRWKNQEIPANLIHVHGTADRVLPYCYVHADVSVKNGGHFMLVNQAKFVSKILHEII